MEGGLKGYLIILGESGNGKSSFVNCLLGKEAAKIGSGDSVTREPEAFKIDSGPLSGICLIDTPGFNDSKGLSNAAIVASIVGTVKSMGSKTLLGLVLIQSIKRNRIMVRLVMEEMKKALPSLGYATMIVITGMAKYNKTDDDHKTILMTIEKQRAETGLKVSPVFWDNKTPMPDQLGDFTRKLSSLSPIELDDAALKALGTLLVALGALAICQIF